MHQAQAPADDDVQAARVVTLCARARVCVCVCV